MPGDNPAPNMIPQNSGLNMQAFVRIRMEQDDVKTGRFYFKRIKGVDRYKDQVGIE